MKLFIWLNFIGLCLSVLAYAILLAASTYPRRPSQVTALSDVVSLLFRVGFGVWAAYLLFR